MKEGYQKRLDDDMYRTKFSAYVTYASITASVGGTPKTYEEWDKPAEPDQEPVDPSKLKDGRRISAAYKRKMEAAMNKI